LENFPGSKQSTHTCDEIAPTTVEYFPFGQLVQDIVVKAVLYDPAGHKIQADAAVLEYTPKMLQSTQSEIVVEPITVEYFALGQYEQLAIGPIPVK
jgi:hypothetical protein